MHFFHRTWAEIDMDALVNNFNIIKSSAGGSLVMAVVKANAYGHSAEDVAIALQNAGADGFAVSNISEALQLRKCGIIKPVLILGYTPVEAAPILASNDISQCVYCMDYALRLSEQAVKNGVKIKIHIKLDTGMSRLGFDCRSDSLTEIADADASARLEGFIFEGVFTHFASADRTPEEEDGFTDIQFSRFVKGIEYFKSHGLEPKLCHCCNSAAHLLDPEKHLQAVRPGIILYGLTPNPDLPPLKDFRPVMTLKSVVSMVKEISAGDTVNYGRTFRAQRPMKIATVAAGYADGYPRALSNKAHVLIHGKRAPVIGRICMDQMSVDISGIEDVSIGDEVVLFGEGLPVEELAELCGTINYEIICNISPRVQRVRKNHEKVYFGP